MDLATQEAAGLLVDTQFHPEAPKHKEKRHKHHKEKHHKHKSERSKHKHKSRDRDADRNGGVESTTVSRRSSEPEDGELPAELQPAALAGVGQAGPTAVQPAVLQAQADSTVDAVALDKLDAHTGEVAGQPELASGNEGEQAPVRLDIPQPHNGEPVSAANSSGEASGAEHLAGHDTPADVAEQFEPRSGAGNGSIPELPVPSDNTGAEGAESLQVEHPDAVVNGTKHRADSVDRSEQLPSISRGAGFGQRAVNGSQHRHEGKHRSDSKHQSDSKPRSDSKHTRDSKHRGDSKHRSDSKHRGDRHRGDSKHRSDSKRRSDRDAREGSRSRRPEPRQPESRHPSHHDRSSSRRADGSKPSSNSRHDIADKQCDAPKAADHLSYEDRQALRGKDGCIDSRARGGHRHDSRAPRDRDRDRHGRSSRDDRQHDRDRGGDRDKRKRQEEQADEAAYVAKVEAALEASQVDEDRLIEERRKRRQELLAKLQQPPPQPAAGDAQQLGMSPVVNGLGSQPAAVSGTATGTTTLGMPAPSTKEAAAPSTAPASQLTRPDSLASLRMNVQHRDDHDRDGSDSPSLSDHNDFEYFDDGDLWQKGQQQQQQLDAIASCAAAADIDMMDVDAAEQQHHHAQPAERQQEEAAGVVPDMFADDADADMFAATPTKLKTNGTKGKALADNFDDSEGYYNFQVGEIMDSRYEVFATHGKGVFSTVLRARDRTVQDAAGAFKEVAIKIIRANDTMYKAGQLEKVILNKLSGADPDSKRHCIRLLRTFDYRNHLCLVFEAMDINLRELTKKYGRGIGLNITAVAKYAAQMLVALYHLRNCGVLHADVKPDNILVSASRTVIKLADFGSAMFSGDNDITPYLVSRFYRAPEIILGLKYEHAMDMWSIGCVLYELFTGKILFPGRTNNEMLKMMMDVRGPFPRKMLKKGAFTDRHFEDDPNMSFALLEEDPVTRRPVRRLVSNPTIKKDFQALLSGTEGDRKKVGQLADFLERMMAFDPEKRLTPKDALRHPFIKDWK